MGRSKKGPPFMREKLIQAGINRLPRGDPWHIPPAFPIIAPLFSASRGARAFDV